MPEPGVVRIIIEGDASQLIAQLAAASTAFKKIRITAAESAQQAAQAVSQEARRVAQTVAGAAQQAAQMVAHEGRKAGQAAGGIAKQVRGDVTGAIRGASAAIAEAHGIFGRFVALVRTSAQVFVGLALYDVAIRALQGIKALAGAGIRMNAVIEQSAMAFTRATGSAAAAFRHLRELQMLAVRTAYDFGTLLESSKALQAWGYRAEDVVPIMEAVGNALAASGRFTQEYINRVILALGQIRQKGRLYGQEIRQLAEAGIPMAAALTWAFRKPLDQLEKTRISADQAVDALLRYIQQSPKYARALEDQTKTFPGLVQRIRETGEIILGYLSAPFYMGFKAVLAKVADFLGRFAEQLLPADRIREGARVGMGEFRRFAEGAAGQTRSLFQAFLALFSPGPIRDAVAQWLEIFANLATVTYRVGRAVWENIGGIFVLLRTLLAPIARGFTDLAQGASELARSSTAVGFGLELLATRFLVILPLQRLFEAGLRRLGVLAATQGIWGVVAKFLLDVANAFRLASVEAAITARMIRTSSSGLSGVLLVNLAMLNRALMTNLAVVRSWATRVAASVAPVATTWQAIFGAGLRQALWNLVTVFVYGMGRLLAFLTIDLPRAFSLAGARAAFAAAMQGLSRISAFSFASIVGILRGATVAGTRIFAAFGGALRSIAAVTATTLSAIFRNIPGILLTALVMFLPEIINNWQSFKDALIATWQAIVEWAKVVGAAVTLQIWRIPELWRQAQEATARATAKWRPTLSKIWQDFKATWTLQMPKVDFDKYVREAMQETEKWIKQFTQDVGQAGQGVAEAGEEAKRAAQQLASALAQIASSTSNAVGEILRSFGEGTQVAVLRIRATLEGLREEILALPGGVGVRLAEPISNALRLVPQLAAGSKEALAALAASARETLQRVAATLMALGRTVPDEAREGLLAVKKAMLDLQVAIAEAFDTAYTKARDYTLRMAEFLRRAGRISGIEFMRYIAAALSTTRAGTEAELEYRERLYEEALSLLDEELERVRETWDERIRMAEEAVEAEIRAREEALEALEEERTRLEREEAEREHAQKLADIEKELAYHRVRTGLEHQKKIEELLAQRAELEREWQQKQAEWQIEDRREQLQREIDDLREQGRKRIEELQRQRDETLKVFEDQFKRTIALAAAYSPEIRNRLNEPFNLFLEDLKSFPIKVEEILAGRLAEAVQRAWETRLAEIQTEAQEVSGGVQVPDIRQVSVVPLTEYVIRDDTAWAWARTLGQILGQPVEWDDVRRQVLIGGRPFPTILIDERGFVPVRRVVEAFGGAVRWLGENQPIEILMPPRAHRGAKVLTEGLARLAPGELVFPPALATRLERLIAVLERWSGFAGTQVNLHGPLFSAEKVAFDSRAEMELLARRLAKSVVALGAVRG